MLFALFLSLFATAIFNTVRAEHVIDTIACTNELEEIVFVPKNCSLNYLKSITKILRTQSPLFWATPEQAASVLRSFENTYNVKVVLWDAMGRALSAPGTLITTADKAMFTAYQRANALGEGFTANNDIVENNPLAIAGKYNVYSSLFWNVDGQLYNVAIYQNAASAFNFC